MDYYVKYYDLSWGGLYCETPCLLIPRVICSQQLSVLD